MFGAFTHPPGTPHTLFSPFPPGHPAHPGAPPGHVILHPGARQLPPAAGGGGKGGANGEAAAEKPPAEEDKESAELKMLKQIFLRVRKIETQGKENAQALRDINNRQATIEDRLSLMDQRVDRIAFKTDELLGLSKTGDENTKKAVDNIALLAGGVEGLKGGDANAKQAADEIARLSGDINELRGNDVAQLSAAVEKIRTLVDDDTVDTVEENTKMLLDDVASMKNDIQELKGLVAK